MAGGIGEFTADPYYVNDSDTSLYCGTAWDAEEEERAVASAYAEGLVVFNFLWNAHEAGTEVSPGRKPSNDKTPVQARTLLVAEARQAEKIRHMREIYKLARHFCIKDDSLKSEIVASEAKFKLKPPAAAAELVRIYRNHLAGC